MLRIEPLGKRAVAKLLKNKLAERDALHKIRLYANNLHEHKLFEYLRADFTKYFVNKLCETNDTFDKVVDEHIEQIEKLEEEER